ncbi:hypothetical protein BD560DRAFT_399280 [Blakeslea trispora]|nr:hypothetical protein BD560DRAFT_399280 [Blakeslea trispora]
MSDLNIYDALREEIRSYISNERRPTLSSFVVDRVERLKQFSSETPLWETQLINIFKEELEILNKRFIKGPWKDTKKLIDVDARVTTIETPNKALTSKQLTPEQKRKFAAQYEMMANEKKWRIGSKCVEDVMFQIGRDLESEHAIHSWIFDPLDPVYDEHFSDEEVEILTELQLPYDASIKKALDVIGDCTNLNNLEELMDDMTYKRASQFDLWWIKRTVKEVILLFETKKIDKLVSEGSEADLVSRVWSLFDPLFERYGFDCTRPERLTVASESNTNGYTVNGKTRTRKYACSLPDLIVAKNGYEYSCAEYGKEDSKDMNWKEAIEGSLKLPKELKNMLIRQFNRLDSSKQEEMKKLKTFGFLCSKLRMTVQILDQPSNYACRLLKLEEVQVPSMEEEAGRKLAKVMDVVWKTKEMMCDVERVFMPVERETGVQRKRRGKALPENAHSFKQYKSCQ